MTEEKILETVHNFAGAVADYTFGEAENVLVFRHGERGKWFGILLDAPRRSVGLPGEGSVRVLNVKCEPLLASMLRETYEDVLPAYHMNKTHWVSLLLAGNLPEEEWGKLLELSYTLTLPKSRRKYSAID